MNKLRTCVAERDGECNHPECPQLKQRENHCPLDMKAKLVDVYLDTGVSVSVPENTELDTKEGMDLLKQRAKLQIQRLLNADDFTLVIGGEYGSDDAVIHWVKRLGEGDEVRVDKGEPELPPSITIREITWRGDEFRIITQDGEVVEGLASELL